MIRPSLSAAWSSVVFVLKVLPMIHSRFIDWITADPERLPVSYPTSRGNVDGEIWRPATTGPHPGVVLCLGVIPFDCEHPQLARLQQALARAGLANLLYWSPAMRDFRLDPTDIDDLALAYDWLVSQQYIDRNRSGLLGTCVGGSFVLMAAASKTIREQVGFICAFAPFASMWTLSRDIASSTTTHDGTIQDWQVDPLSRKVFVHSLTEPLEDDERALLRSMIDTPTRVINTSFLSDLGSVVYSLMSQPTVAEATATLASLPEQYRQIFDQMTPLRYVDDLAAPYIALMHDRDDEVIPPSESESLRTALERTPGLDYVQFDMFKHLDPTKSSLGPIPLARELWKFYGSIYRLFRWIDQPHH